MEKLRSEIPNFKQELLEEWEREGGKVDWENHRVIPNENDQHSKEAAEIRNGYLSDHENMKSIKGKKKIMDQESFKNLVKKAVLDAFSEEIQKDYSNYTMEDFAADVAKSVSGFVMKNVDGSSDDLGQEIYNTAIETTKQELENKLSKLPEHMISEGGEFHELARRMNVTKATAYDRWKTDPGDQSNPWDEAGLGAGVTPDKDTDPFHSAVHGVRNILESRDVAASSMNPNEVQAQTEEALRQHAKELSKVHDIDPEHSQNMVNTLTDYLNPADKGLDHPISEDTGHYEREGLTEYTRNLMKEEGDSAFQDFSGGQTSDSSDETQKGGPRWDSDDPYGDEEHEAYQEQMERDRDDMLAEQGEPDSDYNLERSMATKSESDEKKEEDEGTTRKGFTDEEMKILKSFADEYMSIFGHNDTDIHKRAKVVEKAVSTLNIPGDLFRFYAGKLYK